MSTFLISAAATGCLYALVALGFVLVFQSSGVLNFAHGSLIAVAAYITWVLTIRTNWIGFLGDDGTLRFTVAVAIAAAATATLAAAIDRGMLSRVADAPLFSLVLITLGLDIVIRTVLAGQLPPGTNAIGSPLRGQSVSVGDTTVSTVDLVTIAATVALVAGLALFLRATTTGLSIRAIAIDREAAEAVGLPVRRLITTTWALSGALAAVAAVLQLSKPGQGLDSSTALFALRAFPAAIVGGLTSVPGAVLGGLLIGGAEAYVQFYQHGFAGGNFHLVAPYAVMVVVLFIRPEGLLGAGAVNRA